MKSLPMNFQLILLALLWVPSSGQNATTNATETVPDVDLNECLVCGEGSSITSPFKMISTSFGMFTCAGLEGAGKRGNIDLANCPAAKESAVEKCVCVPDGPTQSPEEAPVVAPTEPPYVCSICGVGKVATVQDGVVVVPNQANRTCVEYLQAAESNVIQESQCGLLQQFTNEACGCMDASPSTPETDAPAEAPTPAPYECPICGEGMMVMNPENVVTVPNQPERTCGDLEILGKDGRIPEQQCAFLQPFSAQSCTCAPLVVAPTAAPVLYSCPICGDGMEVTVPNGIVQVPTQPDRTCTDLLNANAIGNINAMQCVLLQPFVNGPCGCMSEDSTYTPSSVPSDLPSLSPTGPTEPTISPAPSGLATSKSGCFDNLAEIHGLEKDLQDPSVRRKYILCPGTTFDMGKLNENGEITDGEPFIMIRPNVVYQCGANGSRANKCVLKGGDFALTSYYGVFEGIYEAVDNVQIKGVTFDSQNLFAAVMEAAGDITFVDCVFRMHGNMVPVLMQWRGEGPLEASPARRLRTSNERTAAQQFYGRRMERAPSEADIDAVLGSRNLQLAEFNHAVTFKDCVFRDNFVVSAMGFPGIIENTFGSELNIVNCLFEDNKYGDANNPAPQGYAVRSFGPLNIESSCFIDNVFHNYAPVLVYKTAHTLINNYVKPAQNDLTCDFMALFATEDDMTDDKPTCFDADADACTFTQPPTPAPSKSQPMNPTSKPNTEGPAETPTESGSSASTIPMIMTGFLALALASLL